MTTVRDFDGRELKVGQTVLKPTLWGNSPRLDKRTVVKVENSRVYLDGAKPVALRCPERVYIISE